MCLNFDISSLISLRHIWLGVVEQTFNPSLTELSINALVSTNCEVYLEKKIKKRSRKIPSKTKISEKKRKQTLTHWFQPIATTEDDNNLRKKQQLWAKNSETEKLTLRRRKIVFCFLSCSSAKLTLTHSFKEEPNKGRSEFPPFTRAHKKSTICRLLTNFSWIYLSLKYDSKQLVEDAQEKCKTNLNSICFEISPNKFQNNL